MMGIAYFREDCQGKPLLRQCHLSSDLHDAGNQNMKRPWETMFQAE